MTVNQEASYLGAFPIAAEAPAVEKAEFIKKTYFHLFWAVMAFAGLEFALFSIPGIDELIIRTFSIPFAWLLIVGGFMLVGYLCERWAHSTTSVGMQYLGLGVYVAAESVFFLPILWLAGQRGGGSVIQSAAFMTVFAFLGLTAVVFITRKDFSFLRGVIYLVGWVMLGLIVGSFFFNFELGSLFSMAGIALACGYILYDTSNVLHRYRVGQHVAASLALFASVALLFYYILRLLNSRR